MTQSPTRPTVPDVLRAIDKGCLLSMLPADEARLLAGPVARVCAGVELPMEDQRGAARLLQSVRPWLEGPLSSMGLTIPEPPEPVTRTPTRSTTATKVAEAKLIDGGQRIGVRNLFTTAALVKVLPGAKPARRTDWAVYTLPATPAAARALLDTLAPFGVRASRGVVALSDAHQVAQDARSLLVDGAPLPDVDPQTYGVKADLWGHQHRGIAYGEASLATLMAIKMGGGKRLALTTSIPTPSGWTTMGELRDGDELFDDRGEVCRVTVAHPVVDETDAYELEFSDGERIVADAEHLWFTHTRSDRMKWTYHRARSTICPPTGAVRSTAEIAATLHVGGHHAGGRELVNHSIPVAEALQLPDVDLPVSPYVLGQWLGNGERMSGLLCAGGVRVDDEYVGDGDQVRELLAAEGYRCGPNLEGRQDRAETFTVYGLVGQLRTLGVLGNKRIPAAYLRASEKQRRALLAGLLDTDGTVCGHGRVQFDSRTLELAGGVCELATSLGYRPTWQEHRAVLGGRDHGPSWRVSFTTADPVFRLARKVAAHEQRSANYHEGRNRHRYIVAARRVPSVPMRCITVDSSSRLYLAGRAMVPTHNTISAIALANRVQAATVLIVCPNRVRAVWTREVRERSLVGWHIEDGTRPSRRRGGRRQDLAHPERLERCQRVLFDCDCGAPVHAFVLNYEALAQRVWQEWEPAQKLDMIIWDEAHRLKNHLTKVKKRKAKAGQHEAALPPHATDDEIKEARRLDAMGPRERQLYDDVAALIADGTLEPGAEPGAKELRLARVLDKAEHRKEEEYRASKLTVSGVAARWVEWSHRRIALTGTPFPQHPWDIFGLYRALDPGVFGQVWTPFKDKFLEMDKTGTYPKAVRRDMLGQFANLSMSLMYRPVVDLDLPPATDVVRTVELEPEARKAYTQLDTQLWTDLSRWLHGDPVEREPVDELDGPTELTAQNVLSRLLRLQQLTGGTLRTDPVKGPDGRLIPGPEARVSTAKTDALAEFEGGKLTGGILDEIGCRPDNPGGAEPTVVFCRFKSDLDAVKAIAVKAGLRYGEVSGRRGDGLNSDARMSEEADLVGVQIQAGGTGVDLTRARYAIWYSLGYSVSDYDQARARVHRPGQTRPVVYIHLLAEDTADQEVYDAIKARKAAVAAVLLAGGVDPAEAGLGSLSESVGADPTAPRMHGAGEVDSASAAVQLPWEL